MASGHTSSSEFKAPVVCETLNEQDTISELACRFEVPPSQISQWKKEMLAQLESLFDRTHPGEEMAAKDENLLDNLRITSLVSASNVSSWALVVASIATSVVASLGMTCRYREVMGERNQWKEKSKMIRGLVSN